MTYKTKVLCCALIWILSAGVEGGAAETIAIVGGQEIAREDVEKHVKGQLIKLENQRYEILRDGLSELITEQLIAIEAEKRGQAPEQYLADEVEAKIEEPGDELIREVYEANKKHLQDRPKEEALAEVVKYLKDKAGRERFREVVAALEVQYGTHISLQPPRVDVGTGGRPTLGGDESAPITIIEFSDYECPYCKRAEPAIKKVLETYGDKVRFVYRDYPLDFHENARPAAQAARCAETLGAFWVYHEKLMASEVLSTERYRAIAAEVGLDQAAFDECLASNDFAEGIDRDFAEGEEVGVSGTPAFFVNGQLLGGAQPFARFKEVIDAELARIAGE